jgi:DNA-binding LacI/PurR family transcriptional regulator
MIGVVTIDILLHGASLIANGIREQAKKRGYGTSLAVVSTHSLDKITVAIDELKSQRVEFIIMNIPLSKEESELLVDRYDGIHFVFIDVPLNSDVNTVCCANYEGAKKAAELMIGLHRKRFLVITGPQDSSAAEQRLKGWVDTLNQHDDVHIVSQFEGDWQASSGYFHAHQALNDGLHFDAVLVGNDQMALGVLRALNEFNLTVPQQVSVIGFDDTADSAYFSPPLTTIKQDFLLIGERSVLMALSMAEKTNATFKQETIVTEVVERKSTQMYQQTGSDKAAIRQLLKQCQQLLE